METQIVFLQNGEALGLRPASHLMVSADQAEGGSELRSESSKEELTILTLNA